MSVKLYSKKVISLMLSLLLIIMMASIGFTATAATTTPTLTFSDSGITETVSGSGYSISGTALTIASAGTYRVTGSCSEGNIVISGSLSDVVLILDDLTLTSSSTAPIVIKKSTSATIHLEGTSTITDAEDPDNETSTDTTVADAFEGAAIKAKSYSTLTFCGDGTLNADGSACKNGIKGGTASNIIFNDGTYNVTALNNGIAADGILTINAGTFNIDVDNDGIKSVPDSDDTESTGSVYINGGTFDITADGDGIQAETLLEINNGTFDITTLNGYNSSGFDSDTMSCKGLKTSGDRTDIENDMVINGGTFTINAADDAIHSDVYAEIYGGTFTIDTGDDGIHADTSLTLGVEGSSYERDPDITINNSYEGIESGTLYFYQGRYYVSASDDGINAAGGSSSGSEGEQDGGDSFNPGGEPGGPGGQSGPGGSGGPGGQSPNSIQSTGSSDTVTVYFTDALNWGTVYAYYWQGGASWPGTAMTLVGTNDYSQKVYSAEVASDAAGIVFNNGSGTQTVDITSGIASNAAWYPTGGTDSSGHYLVGTWTYTSSSDSDTNTNTNTNNDSTSSTGYNLYIYGGNIYIDCTADGLDSNGGLYLYGGNVTVLSMASGGDNSPIDCDGTTLIDGATVFLAGTAGMDGTLSSGNFNQKYYSSTSSYSAGKVINITHSGSVVYSEKLLRNVNYLVYSSPSMTSNSCTVSTANSVTSCKSNDWAHSYNSGVTTTSATASAHGVTTYTCSKCGKTETQTLLYYNAEDYACDGVHAYEGTDTTDEGYDVTFDIGEGASVNVYYTQDYTAADETGVTSTVSRNSDTGEPDSTGTGQVNFTVVLDSGYSLDGDPVITGSYNKLKDISSDSGVSNTYRVTKVTSDLTITVNTVLCTHENVTGPTWTWSDDCSTATAQFYCSDCSQYVDVKGTVSSVLGSDGSTITFTATAELNDTEYTDTTTGTAYKITFVTDDHSSVNIYYTQDYSSADETDVTTAVARDSDTGCPVIDGSGQLNFTIVADDGYEISGAPTVEGSYKNLKDVSTDDLANTYRVTKIAGDITVTVTSVQSETESTEATEESTEETTESTEVVTESTESQYELGDVNMNGKIDISDSTQVQKYLSRMITLTDEQLALADVDGNGQITVNDATLIQMYLSHIISSFD